MANPKSFFRLWPMVLLISFSGIQLLPGQTIRFLDAKRKMRSLGTSALPNGSTILTDLNGDGRLDVIAAQGRFWDFHNSVYLNEGQGKFKRVKSKKWKPSPTMCVAAGDYNADGHTDFVAANYKAPHKVYLGKGNGYFTPGSEIALPPSPTWDLVQADLDGDGREDLVFVNRKAQHQVLFSSGNSLQAGTAFGNPNWQTVSMAPIDWDNDGDLDLYGVSLDSSANVLYLNDGKGNFDEGQAIGFGGWRSRVVIAADLNQDGRPELVIGNVKGPNFILRPETGEWVEFEPEPHNTLCMQAVDMDKDGDLDLVVGNGFGDNYIYYNDGTGFQFTREVLQSPKDQNTIYISVGDLNGDGTLEVVESHAGNNNRFYRESPRQH